MASLQSIVYQPLDQKYGQRLDFFLRTPTESAALIAGHGIQGDRKAGHSPTRQVNIIPTDWLEKMAAQGYDTRPGAFGEQLIVEGVTFDELLPGTRLQIGDQAMIEITKSRTGCDRMEMAQTKPVPEGVRLAGIGHMAKVVQSGTIRVGDAVKKLSPEPA